LRAGGYNSIIDSTFGNPLAGAGGPGGGEIPTVFITTHGESFRRRRRRARNIVF